MNDSGAMNCFEACQTLNRQLNRLSRGKNAAAPDHLRQILTFDVLPNHVVRSVGKSGEIVQRGDIRMLDLRCQLGLAQKAVMCVGSLGDLRPNDLDHANRFQESVLDLVDLSHAARAEALEDSVFAVDDFTDLNAHRGCIMNLTMVS